MDNKIWGTFWLYMWLGWLREACFPSSLLPHPHAYHVVFTLPCAQLPLSRHDPLMLIGSRSQIHVHRYRFSSLFLCVTLYLSRYFSC
jgi:hypothetical protein